MPDDCSQAVVPAQDGSQVHAAPQRDQAIPNARAPAAPTPPLLVLGSEIGFPLPQVAHGPASTQLDRLA